MQERTGNNPTPGVRNSCSFHPGPLRRRWWEKGQRKADRMAAERASPSLFGRSNTPRLRANSGCRELKMVRSLSHWTKTLSFPARISPNKQSKENLMNLHNPNSPTVTPTPSNNSLSQPCTKHNEINNMKNCNSSLTEVSRTSPPLCTVLRSCNLLRY